MLWRYYARGKSKSRFVAEGARRTSGRSRRPLQAQPLVGKQYSQVAQVVTRGAGHNGITQGFE
jgi:hypothetical protein